MSRTCFTLAAALALAGIHPAAHATTDWLTPAPTCVPDSLQTLQLAVTDLSAGVVRSGGRNPPLAYSCPVHNPDDLTAAPPSWRYFRLQYLDPNSGSGAVVARLLAKRRDSGTVSTVATLTSTGPTSTVKVIKTRVPPLDFTTFGYYVTITLDSPSLPVEAHMVMLTTN